MIRRCSPLMLLLALLVSVPPLASGAAEPRASLEVAIDGPTLAGQPLLLKLTIKNTGDAPFFYWCGGPESYPTAEGFTAVFVDSKGDERSTRLSNGQYVQGSGEDTRIAPGETVTFPAAAEPLPEGNWALRSVTGEARGYYPGHGKPMVVRWPATETKPALRIEVREDAKAAAAFAEDLLRRVRKNDPFARHVGMQFKVPAVIDAARHDLESDDPAVVVNAAQTLLWVNPLPRGLGAIIKRSMSKHLRADPPDGDAVSYLATLAGRGEPSDDALDALLAYVRAEPDIPGEGDRRYRLQHLFNVDHPRAREALRAALQDPHLALTAALGLARHRDPAALPVLLDAARDRGHIDRGSAFIALADYYWDAPPTLAALGQAAHDPKASDRVRAEARQALESALVAKARAAQAGPVAPETK